MKFPLRIPRLLSFALLALCAGAMARGEPQQDLMERFTRGNIAYGNGAFEEAEKAYREVLEHGQSAELHYNLGNALAQQKRWSEAAYHYMRAYQLKPGFEPARANLMLAAQRMGLAKTYPKLPGPANLLSQSSWTLIAAIAFWAALILFFHGDFVKFRIPLGKSLGTVSVLALLVAIFAIVQHQLFHDWTIVSEPLVSLRVAPTEQSPGEKVLIEGDPVRILGEQAGFYHVMTSEGDEGFILQKEFYATGE